MKRAVALGIMTIAACGGAQRSSPPAPTERAAGAPETAGEIVADPPPAEGEPAPAIECAPPPGGYGAMTVMREIYDTRTGARATKFSELRSTQQRPLEECGIDIVLDRLATLTCDDGSNPFGGNRATAHDSRAGNMGPGGRCGSIIDLYEVTCPEGSYQVYADMYFCPP